MYPRVRVDASGGGVVSQAGGLLLVETVRAAGLDVELSQALAPWRKPTARHDPAKQVIDLAIALALGGDCLADAGLLRTVPEVFGLVASDPTISRTVDMLAADVDEVLTAVNTARAAARARVWRLAGEHAPDAEDLLIVDADATLVCAHSDKERAAPTFKKGFGFHPLLTFVDHSSDGTGEPLSVMLRPGNAGSNTAADHIAVVEQALVQLPGYRPGVRPGRKILIRTDAAGCTHEFLDWVTRQGMAYSVGFTLPAGFADTLRLIPKQAWVPAVDADGEPRDGAWVADVTETLDLSRWPTGTRVIARKERPHPGAQLKLTDVDGCRVTAFATNTRTGKLADLELRHRRRARAEDRIRCAKDTGLRNLPLHDFAQNQIWCAIVTLACELIAWMQTLALAGHKARRWEPKRLRLRLFSAAARLAQTGRRVLVRLARDGAWTRLLADGITRLRKLAAAS